MQIQFEAFFARYKMARSMNAAAASEFNGTKMIREETQHDLKSKAFNIAKGFLENRGKAYTEISARLLAEQMRAMQCCERLSSKGCSTDNSDAGSTDGSSSESFPESGHHPCEHSHSGCERDPSALFGASHSLEEMSCAHASFSTVAAHMMGLSGAQPSCRRIEIHGKTIEINSKTVDMSHLALPTDDKAPFPAANPPAGVESSSVRSSH